MSEDSTDKVVITDQSDAVIVEDNKTPEVDMEAFEAMQKALKKANRESAERRKKLDAFEKAEEERRQAEMSNTEKLEAKVAAMEARAKEAEALNDLRDKQDAFFAAAEAAKLVWASELARKDAVALLNLGDLDDEEIAGAVKELKESRPYLFAQATMHDIDATKRGKGTKEDTEEERVQRAARQFGVKYVPKE
jgi:hypothetical protein